MSNINLENSKDLIIEIQKGLTSFPAYSPSNGGIGEYDKCLWLEQKLIELGLTNLERIDCPDSRVPSSIRPNLACKIQGKSSRCLWLISHLDVVPAGDLSLWQSDPYSLSFDPKDPDIIIGRGVEDNQQAITCATIIANYLIKNKITPELSLGLLFVSDEETSSEHGIVHILKTRPELIKQDDLVLIQDFGVADSSKIEVAEKGVLWLKSTVEGTQCHASTPEDGKNTLLAAAELILRVNELHKLFPISDPLYSPSISTFVPTRHEENVGNINTIPGKDIFYIDCRVLPNYTFKQVIDALDKIAQEVAKKHDLNISITVAHKEEAVKGTDPNSELIKKLQKAIKKIYKIDAQTFGAGGATVASFLRKQDIDVAVWGTFIPNFHTPNERAKISNHINDSKVVLEIIL